MNVVDAIAHAMKAEGIDMLFAYPVNPLIEAAAKLDIRTVIVRQERILASVKHQDLAGSNVGDDHKEYFLGEKALLAGGAANTMNQF